MAPVGQSWPNLVSWPNSAQPDASNCGPSVGHNSGWPQWFDAECAARVLLLMRGAKQYKELASEQTLGPLTS